MNRTEFTQKICSLILDMFTAGEQPILDYCKRSPEEQKRLWEKGLSKCDGEKIRSKHQIGMAADVYFVRDGRLIDPLNGWEYWHDQWQYAGGKPMTEWDKSHFEG